MGRTPCCEKMGLKKGPWTPDEDRILINYIRQNGHNNWRALPKQAGLLRCGKSCRLRWTNYLRPDIKRGNFTQEEEETIIKLHEMLGNRWSAIAARLPGRTDNEIKNVWHTHIKKKLINHHPGNGSTTSTTAAAAAINAIVVPTRKRARKAKAAIKVPKHENIMEPIESTTEGTNNKEGVMAMPTTTVVKNEPVSPQPCTSDVSTVTSTSTTTTTDNDNSSKENVGDHANNQDNNNNNILGELPELNDEFWMEVLSVEDTAMSIEEFPSISEYEPSSSEDVLFGTTTNSTAQSEDMDAFWHNLLTKSHDLPELMELLSKSDVS